MLAVPVIKDVNVIAVIAGSYNEELLRKLLISRIYGGSAYSTVYNSNGDYVIGTDNVNYLLTESNVYDSLGKVSLDGKYTIEDIKKSIQKGEMGSFLYTVNASKRCVVYVPLDIVSANGYRWVMFNVVPYSVIENEAALFTRNSTFTFAAVLILIIILFWLLLMWFCYIMYCFCKWYWLREIELITFFFISKSNHINTFSILRYISILHTV